MQRRDREAGQVHRDLGHPILGDEPPDRLDGLQGPGDGDRVAGRVGHQLAGYRVSLPERSPRFPDIERNRVGAPGRRRVQVDVEGHQELPRPNHGRAGLRVELGRAEAWARPAPS